jgi:hypothetical protein
MATVADIFTEVTSGFKAAGTAGDDGVEMGGCHA